MASFSFDVIFDAAAEALSRGGWTAKKIGVPRVLLGIARDFKKQGEELFSGELQYRKDMRSGFTARLVGDDEAVVEQSARHSQFIRRGTAGGYKGFPYPVKVWAMEKLGLSPEEAGAVAKSVMVEGTSDILANYYPDGARFFEYPKYLVIENEDKLRRLSDDIGEFVVNYAIVKRMGTFVVN